MMRKFTDYLNEAQALMEANVTNPEVITQYAAKIASKLNNEVGKAWFNKKVRSLLINTPDYLNQINPENIDQRRMPPYMLAAIEKGEAIFSFDPNKTTLIELTQTLEHIADWFNRLNDVAQSKPDPQNLVAVEDKILAQRELSKIMKLSVDGAAVAADAWFKAMGNRIKGPKQGVEGGKVVMEWPDGYYAISFNDRTAMMRDGKDLNNCLQHGTYWDSVKNGTNYVIAIRKPNDEAVVGMRFTTPASSRTKTLDVIECKGKNNKPPQAQYLPYVVDLLKKLDANPATTQDLKMAGIHFNKGEYGTFQDVAELVHDEDGIKVWRTNDRFLVNVHGTPLNGTIRNEHVVSIDQEGHKLSVIVLALNAVGLPAEGHLVNTLEDSFIYELGGRFGTPKDIGKLVGTDEGHELYEVGDIYFGFADDFNVFRINTARKQITDLEDVDSGVPVEALVACMNMIRYKPSADAERGPIFAQGICWDGEQYGEITLIGTVVAKRGNVSLYQFGKRRAFGTIDRGEPGIFYEVTTQGTLRRVGAAKTVNENNTWVVRDLVRKANLKGLDDPSSYGVIETPEGDLIASKAELFGNAKAIMAHVNQPNVDALQWGSNQSTAPMNPMEFASFLRAEGELSSKEQGMLVKMLATDKKAPAFIQEVENHKVFDLEVKTYAVHLPVAIAEAFHALDLEAPRQAREDMLRGMQYVEHFIQNNPARYRFTNVDNVVADNLGLDSEWSKLRLAASKSTSNIDTQMRERETNKDKYATDLSSRFAAMNALRKAKK